MHRKWKIALGIVIPLVVLGGFIGGLWLNSFLRDNGNGNNQNSDPPSLEFPVQNTEVLATLYGFLYNETVQFHNGIDFMINDTATIIASCNMTCNDKSLFYNEIGDHWQCGVSFTINGAYELFYAFESFAENETQGNEQLALISVEIGQQVVAGEVIGQLMIHRPAAHIHYMLHENFEPVCPYLYFSSSAKATFDYLWPLIGTDDFPCNDTSNYP